MSKEEQDYASDSDESDEDFCPDKANNSDAPSEEDSDDPISDNDGEEVPASKKPKAKTSKKKERSKARMQTKKPKKESAVEEEEEERVVATRNRSETTTKSSIEKNELESDEEEDSSRKEALWANFLSDIPKTTQSKTNKSAAASKNEAVNKEPRSIEKKETPVPPKQPEKVVVKQIFDFAGEEVLVEKTVSADSIKKTDSSKKPQAPLEAPRGSVKRPPGGGLSSILGQLDKKKKISVLEKSKLDWDSFKTSEGIDEDLRTFNKGKDGYLQRQDFLERTDLRQFEIEKTMRASRRKPM